MSIRKQLLITYDHVLIYQDKKKMRYFAVIHEKYVPVMEFDYLVIQGVPSTSYQLYSRSDVQRLGEDKFEGDHKIKIYLKEIQKEDYEKETIKKR